MLLRIIVSWTCNSRYVITFTGVGADTDGYPTVEIDSVESTFAHDKGQTVAGRYWVIPLAIMPAVIVVQAAKGN